MSNKDAGKKLEVSRIVECSEVLSSLYEDIDRLPKVSVRVVIGEGDKESSYPMDLKERKAFREKLKEAVGQREQLLRSLVK